MFLGIRECFTLHFALPSILCFSAESFLNNEFINKYIKINKYSSIQK